ncbi:MAG TPA: phosphate-starvation-inducible PsiE family protein [Burkholderiales bacterium]|jgi:phosphate starvation-inducible membrane PsiE|nr:phosphate-starvation-inducible PsiE family protein [Burkholderiales bacterium]
MKLQSVETSHKRVSAAADVIGKVLVDGFHYLALFAIGGAIVWSAFVAFFGMAGKGHATIDDILLLFIYLELGAMIGIYFKTNHMPVRFLIYVAMTALTRLLILDVQTHDSAVTGIVWISGAILLLALATLVIRYGSAKFPSRQTDGRD